MRSGTPLPPPEMYASQQKFRSYKKIKKNLVFGLPHKKKKNAGYELNLYFEYNLFSMLCRHICTLFEAGFSLNQCHADNPAVVCRPRSTKINFLSESTFLWNRICMFVFEHAFWVFELGRFLPGKCRKYPTVRTLMRIVRNEQVQKDRW